MKLLTQEILFTCSLHSIFVLLLSLFLFQLHCFLGKANEEEHDDMFGMGINNIFKGDVLHLPNSRKLAVILFLLNIRSLSWFIFVTETVSTTRSYFPSSSLWKSLSNNNKTRKTTPALQQTNNQTKYEEASRWRTTQKQSDNNYNNNKKKRGTTLITITIKNYKKKLKRTRTN